MAVITILTLIMLYMSDWAAINYHAFYISHFLYTNTQCMCLYCTADSVQVTEINIKVLEWVVKL